MRKIFAFCVHHPAVVIGIIAVITALAALQVPNIRLDPRAEIFIAEDNPVRVAYVNNQDDFTYHEETFIGVVGSDIFDRATLEQIRTIASEAEKIPLVKEVKHLLNIDYITGSEAGIEVTELAPDGEVPQTRAEMELFKQRVDSWDFFRNLFISEDHTGSLISITMQEGTETDDLIPIYYDLLAIVDKAQELDQGRNRIFISGVPVVNSLMGDYMIRDMRVFIPFVNLVVIATLFLFFRNIRGVVLPLLTVAISTTWTLALLSVLKWPLTQVTVSLPVMTIAVGIAYGIHVLENVFSDAEAGKRGKEGIIGATTRVSMPVIMAGLTTMGGFASLATTDVVPIKQLGLLAAFGVLAALTISLTFIPAVLSVLDSLGREIVPRHHTRRDVIGPFLRFFSALSLRHSSGVIIVSLIILAVSIGGALRIKSDMDPIKTFKPGSPIRVADDYLNAKFAGTSMFNVVLNGSGPDDIKDPEVLRMIDALEQNLKTIPEVGKVMSITDLIKRMNQVMHNDDPRYYTIPESRELVAQYLLLYSFSGGDEIERFVNHDFSKAQTLLIIKSQASTLAERVMLQIDEFNRQELAGGGRQAFATGISAITREFNHIVIIGQISSFVLALILVIFVTMPIFKSVKLGLFSILPLFIPILINFGLMGFAGISLNAATAMIASISVGVGIDYSIHFLSRYRHELGICGDTNQAVITAINTSGRAIMYNALAVAAGFIVLVLSNFVPVVQSGYLTALVMLTSSTAALTVLPAFIVKFHPRIPAERCLNGSQTSAAIPTPQKEDI